MLELFDDMYNNKKIHFSLLLPYEKSLYIDIYFDILNKSEIEERYKDYDREDTYNNPALFAEIKINKVETERI